MEGINPCTILELPKPQEIKETVRERAARQRQERREVITTAEDYARCDRNRERVLAERKAAEQADIDDVYIIFSDDKKDLKTFAREVYLDDSDDVIRHIIKINPHLKRTFHFLIKGMPIVVSPWGKVHPDEAGARSQVSELSKCFLHFRTSSKSGFLNTMKNLLALYLHQWQCPILRLMR